VIGVVEEFSSYSHLVVPESIQTADGHFGMQACNSPINVKARMSVAEEQVDRERYQRLLGRLIYLCHIRPDISFTVCGEPLHA
jgi:hypothetical protein